MFKMRAIQILCHTVCLGMAFWTLRSPFAAPAADPDDGPLIRSMKEELGYSMAHLSTKDGTKPYYLSYSVADSRSVVIQGTLGAVETNEQERERNLDVDVRVGDYALDSTHQLRGRGGDRGFGGGSFGATSAMPVEDDSVALKQTLWRVTDRAFKAAVDRFQRVQTDLKTTVEEENKADDFSHEKPS